MDDMLTAEELTTMLRIKKATIYAWTRRGLIPHIKIANKTRYPVTAINAWLERQTKLEKEVV